MTAKTIASILDGVAGGLPIDVAARAAGVAPSTVRSHRERHREFAMALDAALSTAKSSMLAHIREAAPKDWKAAAWILERRFPEEFSRPEIRANLATVNLDAQEVARAIHAGMGMLAAKWADWSEPDSDDPASGIRSPLEDLGDGRTTVVNGVLIDTRTGKPLANAQVVARS